MSFHSRVDNLKSTSGPGSGKRPLGWGQPCKPAARSHLRLEVLEDRLLPAVFTVLNTNDSGPDSLRAAIIAANASTNTFDTIKFNIGSGVKTISPLTALPDITDQVFIDGTTQPGSEAMRIELEGSNAGGVNATGRLVGISLVDGSSGSIIRGLVINRFGDGIEMLSSSSNEIIGNYIGTDYTGTVALPNGDGVTIFAGTNNTIGGTTPGKRNLISGNHRDGVLIAVGATGNMVEGNYIGTDLTGAAAVPNTEGVRVGNGAANNTIGGTTPGAGNLIAFNRIGVSVGVRLDISGVRGNAILRNAIFANGQLGIDLEDDGVTPNTPGGPHTGPNNLQNFPLLQAASSDAGGTTIRGTLNSTAGTAFRVEFFANEALDPSGFGQGQTFLGFKTVTTDAGGDVNFTATLTTVAPAGQFITATATGPDGNTSEFSQGLLAGASTSVVITPSANPAVFGQAVTFTATVTSAEGTPTGEVTFALDGGAPQTVALMGGSAVFTPPLLPAGPHSITARYADQGTFRAGMDSLTEIVNPAPLAIRAADQTRVYGAANPAFSVSFTGLVAGQGPGDLAGTLTLGTPATTGSDVGSYPITPAGLSSANYAITFQAGTLAITKADQTIQWSNPRAVVVGTLLGPAQFNATVAVAGPAGAGPLTYTPARGSALAASPGQRLSVTAAATTNYNAATAVVRIDVRPRPMTDATAQVRVTFRRAWFNPKTHQTQVLIHLRNGGPTLLGPVSFVLVGLPRHVKLRSRTGWTTRQAPGSAFQNLPLGPVNTVAVTAPLPPGAVVTNLGGAAHLFLAGEIRPLRLTFANTTGTAFRFSWHVLAGVGVR